MTDAAKTKKRVLVVDDERSVVTYLTTLLEDNGYETVSASDGIEALEKVRAEKPDLVALDITMPKQSGLRFYRDLKADPELSATPVIVVTAVTGYGGKPEEFENFLSGRAHVPAPEAFVPKPIDREAFLKSVRDVLA
jgi:CheY-like chemotaxis protein